MPMRLRAEKRMRKLLLEQLKLRKVEGSRLAQGFKSPTQLQKLGMAPQVFLWKNMFSGQVLYSQVPAFHQQQINQQFIQPNWQNRKPSRRPDLWRVMAVATFDNYDYAVAAYQGLVDLRRARDTVLKDQAQEMRKKNEEGNIWYSGQYRPTYTQEAVADLSHVIDEFELENTEVAWELLWRKGDESVWKPELVRHTELPAFNPRDQTVMLDELRIKALEAFEAERNLHQEQQQIPADAEAAATA